MLTVKKIAVIAVLAALPAALYMYKEYERKPADISEVQPAASVNAAAIIDAYEKNEAQANHEYLGKIIQVKGLVTEINNQQDTLINVLIGDILSMHKVSCLLDRRHGATIKQYAAGQAITIRGVCTGFLLDVELNRCVIIPKSSQ